MTSAAVAAGQSKGRGASPQVGGRTPHLRRQGPVPVAALRGRAQTGLLPGRPLCKTPSQGRSPLPWSPCASAQEVAEISPPCCSGRPLLLGRGRAFEEHLALPPTHACSAPGLT